MPKDTSDFLDGAGDYGSVGFDPLKFSDYPPFPELIAIPSDKVPDKVRYTGARIAELLREVALTPWQAAALLMKSILVTTVMVLLILVFLFAREFPNKEALVNYEPNLMTHIYGQDGEILDEFAITRRIYVPIEQIPDTMQQAFISAEDKNFFTHSGFDLRAIAIAFYEAIRSGGQNTRGASTITQQLLKNVAFRGEQIVDRKIYEIVLAGRIERLLGKDKVLEIYLNEIFLGQNAYGVGAAAQTYFNRPLDELSYRDAAVLAALAQSPSGLHPVRNSARLMARRNYILEEMFENEFISKQTYDFEVSQPIETVQDGSFAAYAEALPARTYFSDGIRRQLSDDLGEEAFLAGGLSVRASLDEGLQAVAARALRRGLESYDRARRVWRPTGITIDPSKLGDESAWRAALSGVNIARDINLSGAWVPAVVLSLGQRNVRIGIEGVAEDADGHWLQGRHMNWTNRQNADGSRGRWTSRASDLLREGEVIHVRALTDRNGRFLRWSMRQVPELQGGFMAMEVNTGRVIAVQGGFSYQHSPFNRATQALRQPGSTFKPVVYAAALDAGYSPTSRVLDGNISIETAEGIWRPRNAGYDTIGYAPLRIGLEQSRNLMTVRVAQDVGLERIGNLAEGLGLYEQMELHIANALGSQETTLANLVSAYATIVNGGRLVQPTHVDEVLDRYSAPLFQIDRDLDPSIATSLHGGPQVLDPITAYQVTSMMQGVIARGTARSSVSLPVPTAGKTGTTNEAKDVWFVGFTSNLVAGCYMGFDTPRTLGSNATGGSFCGPVFQEFMTEAVKQYGGSAFTVPEGGYFIKANRQSGSRLSRHASGRNVVTEFIRN